MTPGILKAKRRGRLSLPLLLAFAGWLSGVAAACGCGLIDAAGHVPEASVSGVPYLSVIRDDGSVVAHISLAAVHTWILRWNHSVTGIEVSDHYAYENGSMVLTASHMPAFDAGLGHIPGRGSLESDGEGGYWVRDIQEPVAGNAYRLRVGSPSVDHRILHDGCTYSLSSKAAGDRVTIRVTGP